MRVDEFVSVIEVIVVVIVGATALLWWSRLLLMSLCVEDWWYSECDFEKLVVVVWYCGLIELFVFEGSIMWVEAVSICECDWKIDGFWCNCGCIQNLVRVVYYVS